MERKDNILRAVIGIGVLLSKNIVVGAESTVTAFLKKLAAIQHE